MRSRGGARRPLQGRRGERAGLDSALVARWGVARQSILAQAEPRAQAHELRLNMQGMHEPITRRRLPRGPTILDGRPAREAGVVDDACGSGPAAEHASIPRRSPRRADSDLAGQTRALLSRVACWRGGRPGDRNVQRPCFQPQGPKAGHESTSWCSAAVGIRDGGRSSHVAETSD